MKTIAIVLLCALLAAPALAMTANQTSYLKGFEDGWSLCYLRLTNVTAYNAEAAKFNAEANASLNESEASAVQLALVPTIPPIFDPSVPIEALK